MLFSVPCYGSKKFQLLILSLKETEAENAETDRQREGDPDHEFMYMRTCTQTQPHPIIHTHKPSLTHTLIISCFLSLSLWFVLVGLPLT